MIYLLALALLGNVATLIGFLTYLSKRDDRERQERGVLLTRIQHPDRVPVADVEISDGAPKYVGPEDDEGFKDLAEIRMGAWQS